MKLDTKVKEEEMKKQGEVEIDRKVQQGYKMFIRQAKCSREICHFVKEAIH